MILVGLTGGIACGKSTVLKLFREAGAETIDCDEIVHNLYFDENVVKKIKAIFGTADREKIALTAFSDAEKRKALEMLLHPLVLKELKRRIALLRNSGKKLLVADVPLLFEAGWEHFFHKTVVVKSDFEKQVSRLQKQGLSRKQAMQRINSQMPLQEKVNKAHYVIDNTKSIDFSREQVLRIMRELDG